MVRFRPPAVGCRANIQECISASGLVNGHRNSGKLFSKVCMLYRSA